MASMPGVVTAGPVVVEPSRKASTPLQMSAVCFRGDVGRPVTVRTAPPAVSTASHLPARSPLTASAVKGGNARPGDDAAAPISGQARTDPALPAGVRGSRRRLAVQLVSWLSNPLNSWSAGPEASAVLTIVRGTLVESAHRYAEQCDDLK